MEWHSLECVSSASTATPPPQSLFVDVRDVFHGHLKVHVIPTQLLDHSLGLLQ